MNHWSETIFTTQGVRQRQRTGPLGQYPVAASPLQHVMESWADSSLFWCAIPLAMQVGGLAQRMAGESPEFMKAFAADRAALTVGRARPGPADNAAHLATQLRWLESLLADGRPFLLGAVPCIADVAAAQSVWHLRRAPLMADTLAQFPRVAAWYTHVNAFGQGRPTPMSSAEALEVSRRHVASILALGSAAANQPLQG